MKKSKTIHLIKNGKSLYVARQKDYDICLSLGTPMVCISRLVFPLLVRRCKKAKVKLEIRSFSDIEHDVLKKIEKKWPHDFEIRGQKIVIQVPKRRKFLRWGSFLAERLKSFYGRNMYDVELKQRRFATKVQFILIRRFNEQKRPEWKEKEDRNHPTL